MTIILSSKICKLDLRLYMTLGNVVLTCLNPAQFRVFNVGTHMLYISKRQCKPQYGKSMRHAGDIIAVLLT